MIQEYIILTPVRSLQSLLALLGKSKHVFYYIVRGHLNMEIEEIGSGSVKTLEGIFFNLM